MPLLGLRRVDSTWRKVLFPDPFAPDDSDDFTPAKLEVETLQNRGAFDVDHQIAEARC